jgi:ABC-type branched-subunit amino acid transport system ATPase component
MVEQHAHKALNYTDHAIVMRRGRVGLDLTGEQARTRIGDVEQAYLTSAGGDVTAGEADLAAQHPVGPTENNSAG